MENSVDATPLTDRQRARIERNRQRAILLRNARLANHPYLGKSANNTSDKHNNFEVATPVNGGVVTSRTVDTGGGFFIDLEEQLEAEKELKIVHEPVSELGKDWPRCNECCKEFIDSFLLKNYSVAVCDGCRDNEEKHALITKTDAKTHFLLKDCDLDKREPPLKCIVKKNPHKSTWGDMKLYLKSQVFARSLEVWGDEEAMEEERERRANAREKRKEKQFDKKVKELRRAVRTSTWKKNSSHHVHEFPANGEPGEEVYDEKTDTWTKTCRTCGYSVTYEKM
ncbi:DNA repair protein complementing XP-A cells homolog [Xenia sp. Carnegie-2017]|uniref:DNA repair protein complementing XP-A cells homolog n=1 Tax=Xenia sp. Carnegie-2017 TaxID=2897299 RepID=UPI001F045462|nr:DNA repair protein complementing XP-A cells homolog [Xenia sp. Carnegie-2017]